MKKETSKVCRDCKIEKELTEYHGQYYHRCKPCHSKIVMENQKQKADYYNKYRGEYSKNNPEKRRAWNKASIERWEKENGMAYSEYANERHQQRLKEDKTYAKKTRRDQKKYRSTRS